MHELPREIPNASLLLSLTPEELGAKMLFLLRRRHNQSTGPLTGNGGMYILNNLQSELWPSSNINNQAQYSRDKQNDINLAITEAWAWLTAQGLLVPANGINGQNGCTFLVAVRKRWKMKLPLRVLRLDDFYQKKYFILNATPVWGAFMRGEFDVAAFQAMKGVEVAVRAAAELGDELIGVKLMRNAFAPRMVRFQIWLLMVVNESDVWNCSLALLVRIKTPILIVT